jgi:hypothetical protein
MHALTTAYDRRFGAALMSTSRCKALRRFAPCCCDPEVAQRTPQKIQRPRQVQRQTARGLARSRKPGTVGGRGRGFCGETNAPLSPFLRFTGLPSRSARGGAPLRLTALRWLEALGELVQSRPPPGVSTAFLPAVARFSVTESRGSPTRHCAHRNSNAVGTMPCTARPPVRDVSCSDRLAPAAAAGAAAASAAANSSGPGTATVTGHGFRPPGRSPTVQHGKARQQYHEPMQIILLRIASVLSLGVCAQDPDGA